MPGVALTFQCSCGYKKQDVGVGASEEYIDYSAFLCLKCKKVIPVLKRSNGEFNKYCHICGTKFVAITDPEAWVPSELQQRFPDCEPWMVEDEVFNLGEEEAEKLLPLAEQIRILCPRCGKHSLSFEVTELWD
jgi:hypothetical protein